MASGSATRLPALFTLLVVFQGLTLGDAVILAWLRRSWWVCVALGTVTLPFLLVGSIAGPTSCAAGTPAGSMSSSRA